MSKIDPFNKKSARKMTISDKMAAFNINSQHVLYLKPYGRSETWEFMAVAFLPASVGGFCSDRFKV